MAKEGKQSPGATRPSNHQQASAAHDSRQAWVNGRGIFMVALAIAAFGVVLTALDGSHSSGPSIFDFGAAPAGNAAASAPASPKPNGMVRSNVPERPPADASARSSVEPAASADQRGAAPPTAP